MLASRLLIPLAAAFLLWLSLPGTFVFDDHSLFIDPAVAPTGAWRQWWKLEQTRPLTYITFWLDYHLWGPNAAGFRFTNLLIHAATAGLLFLTTRRLFDQAVAITAAALFLLHPLTHEPLLYVFARGSSLAALFCLLSLYFWLNERRSLAAVSFALSLLAKEEWVAFPIALACIDYVRTRKLHWPWIAGMLMLAATAGARVLYATKAIAGSGSGFGQQTTPWQYLLMQGHAIPSYLWRLAVPIRMTIDPAVPGDALEPAIAFWIAALVIAFLCARRGQPAVWLVPAAILLLPSSSILPAADAIAWRRMYLPMAFIALAIALTIRTRPKVAYALLLACTVCAALRRDTWQSEAALWREASAEAPTKLRPYLQLARTAPQREALEALGKAKELAPNDPAVASEAGRLLLESGDPGRALAEFGRALALAPGEARYIQNRGAALLALGQKDAAQADFLRALQRDPCLRPARENLLRLGVQPPPDACPAR